MEMIKTFAKSESGAVTVDWVVLTAAIVGLGLAVMAVVSGGVEDLQATSTRQLTDMGIDTTFDGSGALRN
jgi:Flp pilus assembly pilin Flp